MMNFRKSYFFALITVFSISGCVALFMLEGCNNNKLAYTPTGNIAVDGRNLVQINCTRCHALVPVNALNKNVWKFHTLPAMSRYFGISTYMTGYYKGPKDTAGISLAEWQTIVSYYEKMAPDTLVNPAKPVPLINDRAGFALKTPPPVKNPSFTTLAAIDPVTHDIFTSDGGTNKLTVRDNKFKIKSVTDLPSTAVNAFFDTTAKSVFLSCIGRLEPVDFPNGRVFEVGPGTRGAASKPMLIASDLARPVQTLEGDFNKDGLTDLVILAQGHLKGGVYLFKQNKDKSYSQSTITEQPGAVQAITGDFNNDGWPDLMVLFGSGDEGLWLFLNDHKGGFTQKNLLRFPPVYGSTSFQLADIDHDGKPDLIYTCGYNFHDSRVLKPYHGLYIYKNEGNWNFKQQWFYPINGCTKAIAADFDGDGDLDIATSAFFADMKNEPAESFVYFEQVGPYNFKPHAIPISKYGRWISMEVGDYNGDGKPDIILGNFSHGFLFQLGFKPFWDSYIPFVVLENTFKK